MPLNIVVRLAANKEYYFILQSHQGQKLLSSDRYLFKVSCLDAIHTVRVNATEDYYYQKGTAISNGYFFVLRGNDGEIICTSEIYPSAELRDMAIEMVKRDAAEASLVDQAS